MSSRRNKLRRLSLTCPIGDILIRKEIRGEGVRDWRAESKK